MAMRARWISGGVQTELDGSLSVETVLEETKTYITQSRSSHYTICGLSSKVEDMCVNNYEIPSEADGDEEEFETYSVDCSQWRITSGAVSESWSEPWHWSTTGA